MSLLRFIVLFSFAALSIARAVTCSDFQISANGKSINAPSGNSSVSYPIMIGEDLEFKVSPEGDIILWTLSGITVGDVSSYTPPIGVIATGNTAQTMVLKVKNCGIEKTINIVLSARTYKVTFDPNGGTSAPPEQIVKHGEKALSPPVLPTPPTGHEFAYWYSDNENATFDFNTPIVSNITLKAKWKPKEYDILLITNCPPTSVVQPNCPANPPPIKATYKEAIGAGKLPSLPSLTDYDFKSWFDVQAASGGKEYTATTKYDTAGPITLYARWEIKKYKVTFNSDGGSSVAPQTVEYGKPATPPTAPTKSGYTFYRWETPMGTPLPFPVTSDTTLKAIWTPNIYTITFDQQGGTGSAANKSVTYNTPVGGPLPTPTKAGYDFSGWYSAPSGGTEYTATTVYQTPNNITLYARWTGKKYTITFNPNSPDGQVNPASQLVTYGAPVGTLPEPTRAAWEFKGWFDVTTESGGNEYKAATVYNIVGPITLYARWEFIKGTRPKAEMLNFTIPTGLVYDGAQIIPLTATKKPEVYGKFGTITILYDGKSTPRPINAGTYAISARIDKDISGDYDSATVSLGFLTIAKAPATASILSATAKSRYYNAKTDAEIDKISIHVTPLFGSDAVSPSDYSVKANFASPDVGNGITVTVEVSWLASGPLSKNYIISPSPTLFATTANIMQATGELRIIDPLFDKGTPYYKYTEAANYGSPKVETSSFIPPEAIIFEYKKDGRSDLEYSLYRPDSVGNWHIRATLAGNANYTGATDWKVFPVLRGSAYRVKHNIEFLENSFTKDLDLSDTLRAYYVTESCGIISDTIKITIIGEPSIVIKSNSPHKECGVTVGNCYKIPFDFGKPGLDTLLYTLRSPVDDDYSENDTLFMETPIPFDRKIVRTKWDNLIFINNNDSTNGGYKFTNFEWFKNDSLVSGLQFYSEKSKLDASDIYKATMHTKDGVRISTCKGSVSPEIKTSFQAAKPAVTKQVLGINGKTAKPEQKVYDVYGVQKKDTPAGVYIVKDK